MSSSSPGQSARPGAQEEIYALYDTFLEALRARDDAALFRCVDEEAHFSVGAADGVSRWEGTGRDALEQLATSLRQLSPEAADLGIDVYVISMRSADEAVVLVERWIDDLDAGRRETTLAVETVRFATGSWRVWRSASESTIRPLG